MMHKRTLHSLLIVSFIVVFAASMSFAANEVIVQSKAGLMRCAGQSVAVTANVDAEISALEVLLVVDEAVDCGFLEDLAITWDLDGAYLADRVIDLSGVDGTAPDYIRFAAMSTGSTPDYLPAGTGVAIATIAFTTSDCCEGEASIDSWVIAADPPFGAIQTQFVDAATSTILPVAVTAGTVGISNNDPTITDAPSGDYTILFNDVFTYQVVAEDADACEVLSYDIAGPAGMTIDGSGMIDYAPTGDDICQFDGPITVTVTDKCGAEVTQEFTLCVTNTPPAFTSYPTDIIRIGWGDTVEETLAATDADPGPFGPFFHVVDWTYGVPAPEIDANTGELTWTTGYGPEYSGLFEVFVKVDDGANICDPCSPSNSETISFFIEVNAFQLTISKEEDVILGQERVVTIDMLDEMYFMPDMAGFDFLIQYDASAMTFLYASEGDFLTNCEWEYFTYRYGPNGNCGPSACPTGVLRVVAMGETTGGNLAHSPICTNNDAGTSEELVKLHFLVTNTATMECQFAPIRFVWYDCGDNGVSTTTGDSLLISKSVWDFAGFDEFGGSIFNDVTGMDNTFPTLTGAPDGVCDVFTEKGHPWRLVHFYNGGLDLICADSIDAVGDINLNAIPYEIADAVMFTNYFIEGLSAFIYNPTFGYAGSIAASDTNKDGITLSVADLVYLIRVIIGDAMPYAKLQPVAAQVTYGNDTFGVSSDMGAAYVVVEGNTVPRLLASNMEMKYGFDGVNTNILVYSLEADQTFSGDFLQAEGRIVSTELATYAGQPVVAKLMPTSFEVEQNYPNPFNPTTVIEFQIPNGGAWSLDIFNINGQLVDTFSGVSETGFESVDWDASALSSGVYFYRVSDGSNSLTKKAVLLK